MGVFIGLHHATEAVTAFMRAHPGLGTTHYGPLPEVPTSTTESVRLTLLWVTPQPTHRNDPPYRNAAGVIAVPPVTLSAFFMVTTYGGGDVDPQTAYSLLGMIMRLFHETPVLALPVAGLGEGEIAITIVPTAADLMEKVFTPLQLKHRPFAVLEVGPIQIRPLALPTPDAPPVKPGGIHLDVTAAPPPSIVRITPDRQVPGGAVRIELSLGGAALAAIAIGGSPVPTAAIAPSTWRVVVPTLTTGETTTIAAQTLPLPGRWTASAVLGVLPPTAPCLDAPASATVSIAAALVLDARNVAGATIAIAWPDAGIPGASDARELAITATATSVTILGTELDAKLSATPTQRSLLGMPLRLAVRLASSSFTPYVLIEVTP